MLALYALFTFAVEWSTFHGTLGSSTDAVAVVILPVVMLPAGMCMYGLATVIIYLRLRFRDKNNELAR